MNAGRGGEALQTGTKRLLFGEERVFFILIGYITEVVTNYTLKMGTFYICNFKLKKVDL